MKQRSCWNSFLRASRRCRLIVILPAVEIAMYSIISIVAKFGHSSGYCHVNSFVWHYAAKLALHIRSLHLLRIATTSDVSMLQKLTLCNSWWRLHPTTFHPIHFQSTSRRKMAQCTFNPVRFFLFAVQTRSVWIECTFNAHPMPSADVPLKYDI